MFFVSFIVAIPAAGAASALSIEYGRIGPLSGPTSSHTQDGFELSADPNFPFEVLIDDGVERVDPFDDDAGYRLGRTNGSTFQFQRALLALSSDFNQVTFTGRLNGTVVGVDTFRPPAGAPSFFDAVNLANQPIDGLEIFEPIDTGLSIRGLELEVPEPSTAILRVFGLTGLHFAGRDRRLSGARAAVTHSRNP